MVRLMGSTTTAVSASAVCGVEDKAPCSGEDTGGEGFGPWLNPIDVMVNTEEVFA